MLPWNLLGGSHASLSETVLSSGAPFVVRPDRQKTGKCRAGEGRGIPAISRNDAIAEKAASPGLDVYRASSLRHREDLTQVHTAT